MSENAEMLKTENISLRKEVSELKAENERLRNIRYEIEAEIRDLRDKNKSLLRSIENFSIGFANMKAGK